MSLRVKNGHWEYRFAVGGQRVSKALLDLDGIEQNRKEAKRREKAHRDAIIRGDVPARRLVRRRFSDAAGEFLKHCDVAYEERPNTARRIATSFASIQHFFGVKPVDQIRTADVNRYAIWRRTEHKIRPITLRHDLGALSQFFTWAITMDYAWENPVKKVKKPSGEDAVRMYILSAEEEIDYIRKCCEKGYENLADLARFMLDLGMRPDEVLKLRKTDVDMVTGRLTIPKGKTKAARRTLRMSTAVTFIVQRRLCSPGPWLFPSPKKPGAPLTKLNGAHDKITDKFVIYDFRHTFATRAAQGYGGRLPMALPVLAAILGHSSLRMVSKYVHPQQEALDAALGAVDETLTKDHETQCSNPPSQPQTFCN